MKTKIIPFDIELAKKIQAGEVEGRIVTESGIPIRIICFDRISEHYKPIVAMAKYQHNEEIYTYSKNGEYDWGANPQFNLTIELQEETPKHEFKVGNKVRIKPNKTRDSFIRDGYGSVGTITEINNCEITVAIVGSFSIILSPEELELFDSTPKHEFKPFDKVLVRNNDCEAWGARLYDIWFPELGLHGTQDNKEWKQCIPYEGNEHLVGTTNKPE